MSVAKILTILLVGLALVPPAQARDELEKQMEIRVREQMRKARVECAHKFEIAPLPTNDIDFIAQYGAEKWRAYKDCLLAEMHLDAQHLPPPR